MYPDPVWDAERGPEKWEACVAPSGAKPIRSKYRRRRNENRSKRRPLTTANGSQPRRSQGTFSFQKPWPLSLEPEMSNLYRKLVWPFTFTRVGTWIMNVDTLLDAKQAGVAGQQERTMSHKRWSGFIIHYNKTCKDSGAHDHLLQLRPGKEAALVQQYPPGCSEAGAGSQSRLECYSLHCRVFFLKSRSLCGILHRPSMSWGKSSWTRLINKRNESRQKESTGPARNWSMQSPRMWALPAQCHREKGSYQLPRLTCRGSLTYLETGQGHSRTFIIQLKALTTGTQSHLSLGGPSAGFHGDSTETVGSRTEGWVYPLKTPMQAAEFHLDFKQLLA